MKGIDEGDLFLGVPWGRVGGKAALFCLGLLAMLALIVTMAVLTPLMLAATAFPATTVWQKREPRGRRHGRTPSELSVPHKAVASQGQQGR